MKRTIIVAVTAEIFGIALLMNPVPVADGVDEYAGFLAQHDRLHPRLIEQVQPDKMVVRKAFWNNDNQTLYVNAETTAGKGTLVVVEGIPASDWVAAFQVTKAERASFELPIPGEELVPCRIKVRSAHAYRVVRVINAPPSCVEEAQAENTLLARLDTR